MQVHKERIAQLREMRAAVSKPPASMPAPKPALSSAALPVSKDARKRDIPTWKQPMRHRGADPASHNPKPSSASSSSSSSSLDSFARLLLHNDSDGISPPSSSKPSIDKAGHTEDSIHRRLQATVQLLSESLEEQGHLKALLELTSRPRMFDSLLQHLAHPPDDFLYDVKLRSLRQEKEKLLSQMIDMRTLLEEERTRCQTAETELRVAREMMQGCQADLERSEAEVEKLRGRLANAAAGAGDAGFSSRRPPGTPPAHQRSLRARAPFSPTLTPFPPSRAFGEAATATASAPRADFGMISIPSPVDSPDVSLGCAADYPLPPEDDEVDEEVRADDDDEDGDEGLALLELDAEPAASPGVHSAGGGRRAHTHTRGAQAVFEDSDVESDGEASAAPSPRTHSAHRAQDTQGAQGTQSAASPPAEDVCVLLDIDLGENLRDKIVIRPAENAMYLAYAFMQKHGLANALFEPLFEYIDATQRELRASLAITEGLDESRGDGDEEVDEEERGQQAGDGPGPAAAPAAQQTERNDLRPPLPPPEDEDEEGMEIMPFQDGHVEDEEDGPSPLSQARIFEGHDDDDDDDDDFPRTHTHPTPPSASPERSVRGAHGGAARLDALFSPRPGTTEEVRQSAPEPRAVPSAVIRSRRASLPPPPPQPSLSPPRGTLPSDRSLDEGLALGTDSADTASPAPTARWRLVHSPASPHVRFSFPGDKSLQADDIEEIVGVAAEIMQKAQDLQRHGHARHAVPLYENAIRLFELAECSEVDSVRGMLAEDLL